MVWSPEGSLLAFTVSPGGGLNTQIYLARPDGTGLRRITDGGQEGNQLTGWSHDGGCCCFRPIDALRLRDAYLLMCNPAP